MDNKNIPPFYVGQEVECIKSHLWGFISKGQKFVVTGVYKFCCCWQVTVGVDTGWMDSTCNKCNHVSNHKNNEFPFAASLFSPIITNFESISLNKVLELETPLIGVN